MPPSQTLFDTLADDYDAQFTRSPIAAHLRQRVHHRLRHHWGRGARVLELGCGTGEDAQVLAHNGVHVLATDASEKMLAIAQSKLKNNPQVAFLQLDLANLPTDFALPSSEPAFDGAFSNFGAINCIGDWSRLAQWLAPRLRPKAVVGLGVMARYCLWEIAWHSLHGDFKTAGRRLKGRADFQPNAQSDIASIYYPRVRRLIAAFRPHFQPIFIMPLGLFLPPSDIYAIVERRPRLLKGLLALEKGLARGRWLANFADHYWIEFQKVDIAASNTSDRAPRAKA